MGLIRKKRNLEIRMLILVAIEDELKRSELLDHEIEYIGVGKVNAVFNALNAIKKQSEIRPAPITFAISKSLKYPKTLERSVSELNIEITLINIF